jgi:hypothetical protein
MFRYIKKVMYCKCCNTSFESLSPRHLFCCLECRFWSKVEKLGPDECWNWIAGINKGGYGQLKYEGHTDRAHRIAWILAYGPIPDNFGVLHACDNPACVNPHHLFLGTQSDNIKDCVKKNRQNPPKGEVHYMAKLTKKHVLEIRSKLTMGFRICDLASIYKVCSKTISQIKCRETWVHI